MSDRNPAPVPMSTGRTRGRRSGGALILGILLGGIGALLLVVAVGMPLAVGHRNDLPLERLYGDAAVSLAVRTQLGSVPASPAANPRALQEAQASYFTCAQCHGVTGKGNGVYGKSTYPNATDLTAQDTKEKSDAELFWLTKNGISFAGMPAFATQFNDAEIWGLVAYMRALQNGTAPVAPVIPTTTAQQLSFASAAGTQAQQGAAVYLAQGCQTCHGPTGNAPRNLAIRDANEVEDVVRNGKQGMPRYDATRVSDADMKALIAYINTFNNRGAQQ